MPETDSTNPMSPEFQVKSNYWVRRLHTAWRNLLHEDATPNRIAAGFAIGLFMAYFPAPIIDTLVALAIAYIARANRASCLIGNNFVLLLFPIIPFVFGLEYLIGRAILQQPGVPIVPKDWNLWMFLRSQGPNYHALLVGAVVLALPSAIMSFFSVRIATKRWQAKRRAV